MMTGTFKDEDAAAAVWCAWPFVMLLFSAVGLVKFDFLNNA
jgi:hypothetical protein